MVTLVELGNGLKGTHESVYAVTDKASGLEAFIAIHSTARGAAFGGCRMRTYPSRHAALRDALRLSETMSRKAALARLPFGGGSCVVMGDPRHQKTEALLLALAEGIDRLGGTYLTADDSGTSVLDMEVMRRVTPHARGIPLPTGEACPAAAHGTFMAIQAAVRHRFGRYDLRGRRVAVQGLGTLGMMLCDYLAKAGADLLVSDLVPERVQQAVWNFGAEAVSPDAILSAPVDILSPNAFGDVICDATLPRIRAAVVVGGANNQLRSPRHGDALHGRGILYVPDYVANAGGLIDVAMEGPSYDPARVMLNCESIYHTTLRLLNDAERLGIAPFRLADRIASARISGLDSDALAPPARMRVCA